MVNKHAKSLYPNTQKLFTKDTPPIKTMVGTRKYTILLVLLHRFGDIIW